MSGFYIKYINKEKGIIDKLIESVINNKQDSDLTKQRFLTYIRQESDRIDECIKPCENEDECLRECYSDLINIRERIQNMKSSTKNWKPYNLPCISELLDTDTLKYLEYLNTKIQERTSYGVREELAETDSIKLHWSNSAQKWYVVPKVVKKGEQVRLDANQVLVSYDKNIGHDKIGHAVACAEQLPLYSLSFEAKTRGQTPFLESTLMWAKLQLEAKKQEEEREKNR